jgi:hypothetical protein
LGAAQQHPHRISRNLLPESLGPFGHVGTLENRRAASQRIKGRKKGNPRAEPTAMLALQGPSHLIPSGSTTSPKGRKAGTSCGARQKYGQKDAEQPQYLIGAHHQECHIDRGFGSADQHGNDQLEGLLTVT